mgnify:CR=1 FL=1
MILEMNSQILTPNKNLTNLKTNNLNLNKIILIKPIINKINNLNKITKIN